MHLLIRMPNWLGDCIMATPMIEEAHQKWPGLSITLICKEDLLPLFENHPLVDTLLPLSKATNIEGDIGLLLTNSFSSAWHFFRHRIKMRIGYRKEARSFLLTHPINFPKDKENRHLVDTYKHLLGVSNSPSSPRLYVTAEEREKAQKLLSSLPSPIIGVNSQAAFGPAKCWLPERFRELAERKKNATFLFFGDLQSERAISAICQGLPHAHNYAGKTTLRELMALISCIDLLVTNDSGPMHIAAALKTPLLALFGSTNEKTTGPYKQGEIIHKHVACSPCYKRVCPIDFRCMKQITVSEVLEKMVHLLSQKPRRAMSKPLSPPSKRQTKYHRCSSSSCDASQ